VYKVGNRLTPDTVMVHPVPGLAAEITSMRTLNE